MSREDVERLAQSPLLGERSVPGGFWSGEGVPEPDVQRKLALYEEAQGFQLAGNLQERIRQHMLRTATDIAIHVLAENTPVIRLTADTASPGLLFWRIAALLGVSTTELVPQLQVDQGMKDRLLLLIID